MTAPLPSRADVVVIGSGVGGLTTACRLARAGLDVLLVEQDGHVGGTAGSYVRAGHVIPAGPLGVTVPRFIEENLRACGADPPPTWIRQHFRLTTDRLDLVISTPLRGLGEKLTALFPSEAEGIGRTIELLVSAIRETRRSLEEGREPDLPRLPAETVFGRLLKDRALIHLFSGQAAEPSDSSFPVMVRMWDFLSETGIWTPAAGVSSIPLALKKAFENAGGRLINGRAVERILVSSGHVSGVRLSGGNLIAAGTVVSNADCLRTVNTLIDAGDLPPGYASSLSSRPLSGSVLSVAVAFDGQEWPFDEAHLLYTHRSGEPTPWSRRIRPTASDFDHDQIWISRPPGNQTGTAIIRVHAPYEAFLPFRHPARPHQPGYDDFKRRLGQALLDAAAKAVPALGLRSVQVLDVATPLTYEFWGHRTRGSVAGWAWNADRVEYFTRPPLPGLYLVGILGMSPLILGGMGTSMFTGMDVSARILADLGRPAPSPSSSSSPT